MHKDGLNAGARSWNRQKEVEQKLVVKRRAAWEENKPSVGQNSENRGRIKIERGFVLEKIPYHIRWSLLEKQIQEPHPDQPNQNLWGQGPGS